MRKIFIDSSVIINENYFFDSNDMLLFMEFIKYSENDVLLLSEIVEKETAKNFDTGGINNPVAKSMFRNMTTSRTEPSVWYLDFINEKLVYVDGTKVEIPNIPHSEIIKQYFENKCPFKKGGGDAKGYKDYLLWKTILIEIKKDKDSGLDNTYAFITSDNNDLLVTKNSVTEIVPDLINDVTSLILISKFECYNSIKQFNLKNIPNNLPAREPIETRLKEYFESDIKGIEELIQNRTFERHGDGELILHNQGALSRSFEDYTIFSYEVNQLQVNAVYMETQTAPYRVIDFELTLELNLEGYVYKSELYEFEDDENFTVLDHNHNDHYVSAEYNTTIKINASVKEDFELGLFYDFDVDNIDGV
jgi:hypothetical protein